MSDIKTTEVKKIHKGQDVLIQLNRNEYINLLNHLNVGERLKDSTVKNIEKPWRNVRGRKLTF